MTIKFENYTPNISKDLLQWIEEWVLLLNPMSVYWCDGSKEEYDRLAERMVVKGAYTKLLKRENSYSVNSDPSDVARVEDRTFICSLKKEDAGPTNNWEHPIVMKEKMKLLFCGAMKGRTLYIIPFSMGPIGSPMSEVGIELTDSEYVVNNMRLMTRMGKDVLPQLLTRRVVRCVHSVGHPLNEGSVDVSWPHHKTKYISHFPESREILSFGSGYGGNALLGKKCFALRIASYIAKEEGWLAEHMLILGITGPSGKKRYIAAAFPSACGKTNLAMMVPTIPGFKVECVGDDIAWMKMGIDGKLYAINPEAGFFGVAPGTSVESNPSAMKTIEKDTIFTNVARTLDGDVYWEGMGEPPSELIDWRGERWNRSLVSTSAHPNARFTVAAQACPVLDENFHSPTGVPISAILFGGRRATTIPLIFKAKNWNHGVFLGATMASEKTAAAGGSVGDLRRDPFAMLPFCGYHMGDYFRHWINYGKRFTDENRPPIYFVNWFKKSKSGQYLWPGYGDNSRVLKWIMDDLDGSAQGVVSPIGKLPKASELDLSHLNISQEVINSLLEIDPVLWQTELESIDEHFKRFGDRLPRELIQELQLLQNEFKR